eukprot:4640544-Pyramimonas_sp.AAC.1
MGYDRSRGEWPTAKKRTCPSALCQVLAGGIMDNVNHMRETSDPDALPDDMRAGEPCSVGPWPVFIESLNSVRRPTSHD